MVGDTPTALGASEKILWILFALTSAQLVFQHPSPLLVAGERTNLFSGVLCFITLVAAVALSPKGIINPKSSAFLVSAALALLAGVSGLFSLTPFPSSCRVFVLLASGLGGFWCARSLLHTPANQRRFVWLCLGLLGGVLLLSLLGFLLTGYIEHFILDRSHPLTNVILLLSFAPLALLSQNSRPLIILGIVLLGLSYITLCLSERLSVVFIPLGACLAGALFGTLRLKHLVLIFLIVALVVAAVHQKIIWHKLSIAYPAYRVENFPFSWSIARQHPWFGIGLRAPREAFLMNYQIAYPAVTKKQFAQNAREIVSADNQFLSFMTGLGLPFTLTYIAVLGMLLARLIGMGLSPPAGLSFIPWCSCCP
jgi:O-antigen ligase